MTDRRPIVSIKRDRPSVDAQCRQIASLIVAIFAGCVGTTALLALLLAIAGGR